MTENEKLFDSKQKRIIFIEIHTAWHLSQFVRANPPDILRETDDPSYSIS